MFFLLRVAFWLTVALVLLPTGGGKTTPTGSAIGPTEAVVAASAAVSDVSGFCERQPGACEVGTQAAVVIGQRAQAGAKMVYDFISEQATRGDGAQDSKTDAKDRPKFAADRGTLRPDDLEPAWQGPAPAPAVRTQTLPLPRRDPRRKA